MVGPKYFIATLLAAAFSVAGCAHAPLKLSYDAGPRAAILSADGSTPPPMGLIALCARAPDFCALTPGDAPANAGAGVETSPTGAAEPNRPVDSAAMSHAAMRTSISIAPDAMAFRPRVFVRMAPEIEQMLILVNRKVNWRIRAEEDRAIYGAQEVWALPLSRPDARIGARGDCEDFALEKRAALLARGLPGGALSLTVVFAPSVGLHTVLIVRTDDGDIMLDNLARDPIWAEHAPYTFFSMQRGAALDNWGVVRLKRRPTGEGAHLAFELLAPAAVEEVSVDALKPAPKPWTPRRELGRLIAGNEALRTARRAGQTLSAPLQG